MASEGERESESESESESEKDETTFMIHAADDPEVSYITNFWVVILNNLNMHIYLTLARHARDWLTPPSSSESKCGWLCTNLSFNNVVAASIIEMCGNSCDLCFHLAPRLSTSSTNSIK